MNDTVFVFVVTTGALHRLRVYRIDSLVSVPNRQFVPLLEHEFEYAPQRVSLGDIPPTAPHSSGLLHILVAP